MASGLIPPAWFMTSAAPDVDALCVSFMSSRSEGRRFRLVRAEAAEKIQALVGASSGPQGRPGARATTTFNLFQLLSLLPFGVTWLGPPWVP